MDNMLDYMEEMGRLRFDELPFSEVDNLIFSQLAYCEYEGIDLPCPLRVFPCAPGCGIMENNKKLFQSARTLPRYRECIPYRYCAHTDEAVTKQFAAITFLLPDGTAYVAFRGTDSTLVGWKEDFMLAFATPVPAQLEAVAYLNRVGEDLCCPLRVGGHSKGGNLAVYAAAFCREEVKARLMCIYANDSPGFEPEILRTPEYRSIQPRIKRYLPESSPIGMLLEQDTDCTIVDSKSVGIFQHNPYTWKTCSAGFVTKDGRSLSGDIADNTLRAWLSGMTEEHRAFLTDTVFEVLAAGDESTLHDLTHDPSAMLKSLRALDGLPDEDKRELRRLFVRLLKSAGAGSLSALKAHIDDLAGSLGGFFKGIRD